MVSAAGGPTVVCAADILSEPPRCLSDWDKIGFTERARERWKQRGGCNGQQHFITEIHNHQKGY